MKAKSQACCLGKMMSQYKRYPEYELSLPPLYLKRKAFKRLENGDILLLGLQQLELVLFKDGSVVAGLVPDNSGSVVRVVQEKEEEEQFDSKKYEELQVSFGTLQSRTLEVGHKIEIAQCNLNAVSLYIDGELFAVGSLVNVDDTIAVQINEMR